MPLELNESNLKKAFCQVLACTGIGAAIANCDEVLKQNVLVAVPVEMHSDYPARLLACAIKICTNEPYYWSVKEEEPQIDAETTFQSVYEKWFLKNICG